MLSLGDCISQKIHHRINYGVSFDEVGLMVDVSSSRTFEHTWIITPPSDLYEPLENITCTNDKYWKNRCEAINEVIGNSNTYMRESINATVQRITGTLRLLSHNPPNNTYKSMGGRRRKKRSFQPLHVPGTVMSGMFEIPGPGTIDKYTDMVSKLGEAVQANKDAIVILTKHLFSIMVTSDERLSKIDEEGRIVSENLKNVRSEINDFQEDVC